MKGFAWSPAEPEARQVLEAFIATEMGRACRMLTAQQAAMHVPSLRTRSGRGGALVAA